MEPELSLLQTLVSIPSVNPLLSDDPSHRGEGRLCSFLGTWLAERGFEVAEHVLTPERPNLVASFGPRSPVKTLMIEAHLDTQGVHGMTVPPFAGRIENGRLYGRGACDMKGPMAAALTALDESRLDALAEAGIRVMFVGAMGEETGNLGAEELVSMGIGADQAIVLEPTDLHLVRAHKGVTWLQVDVVGRAAHASIPEQGCNAIDGMMMFLHRFRERDQAGRPSAHELLGPATMSWGKISGGSSVNIVAERCQVGIDRRMLPGESGERFCEVAQSVLDELKAEGHILGGTAEILKSGVPFETSGEAALIRDLSEACRVEGVEPVRRGAGWYSDAGPFSRTCGEVVVFGPGSIEQAHTADEFIEVDALQTGTRILRRFLDGLVQAERA